MDKKQNFVNVLKRIKKYGKNRRNRRDFKLSGSSEQLEEKR